MQAPSVLLLTAPRLALATTLALAFALLAPPANAQAPDPPPMGEPIVEKNVLEESPPPPEPPPLQEPLVVQPPAKPPPRPINALPLVSKDAPPPLIWKWRTFSTTDYVITATGAALTLGAAIVKPRSKHSLSGGIGFDDDVRRALRADRLADRYVFRDASDVGLSLAVTWPFVADSL